MEGDFHKWRFGGSILKYWIIDLLSSNEMTGAMIMDAMEKATLGYWRPSPGSVYPTLEELQNEGYIKAKVSSGKKFYSTTPKAEEIYKNSMFSMMGFGRMHKPLDIDSVIDDLGYSCDYLYDRIDEIKKNKDRKKKISAIIERLENITS